MRYALFILTAVICQCGSVFSQTIYAGGTVRYYDEQLQVWRPLVGVEVKQLNGTPTYTDANGHYSVPVGSNWIVPDYVTIYVFFRNQYIDLQEAVTTRLDSRSATKWINPPPYYLPGDEYANMDFDFTSNWANYAKIFDHANKAANFSIAQGFTPSRCIVRYPLQASIVDGQWISASGSFFWPFATTTIDDLFSEWWDPFVITLELLGFNPQLTANTIYINDLVKYHPSIVYHEYGHFIMKQKRGDWPVSWGEYASLQVPFNHNPDDVQQNSRQSYLEGWANFYELAVSGWVANQSNPYSVGKLPVNGENNKPVIGPDGYKHEYTIANAFWDFYDPAGDENFQASYANISNVMGEKQNLMSEFISTLTHKTYITDVQRNAGINLMSINKMSPITSYGNATMYVKNDFNGGIVNINNSDINTDLPLYEGIFSTTELWMSTYRTLKAKEQMYDNYQRLFKHTNPVLPSDTWTTGLQGKSSFTETWGVYTDNLTFTANFDRACNITFTQLGDGATLNSTVNSYRSETPVTLSAPANITQNGRTFNFLSWENGSTENPRPITANQHQTYTAQYKAHRYSTSSLATAGNNQRKIVKAGYPGGKYCMVYESMNRIFLTTSSDGNTWSNEIEISDMIEYPGANRYPSIVNQNDYAVIVWQNEPAGNRDLNILFRRYNISTGDMGDVGIIYSLHSPYALGTIEAKPVIAAKNLTGVVNEHFMVAWKRPGDGIYVAQRNSYFGVDWSPAKKVDGTSAACINPSIAIRYSSYGDWKYSLCWEDQNDGGKISYIEALHNTQLNDIAFSDGFQVSPGNWYMNQLPSIVSGYGQKRPTVVWQSVDNVTEGTSIHFRQKFITGSGTWDSTITSFSQGTSYQPHPVVGSYSYDAYPFGMNVSEIVWTNGNDVYSAKYRSDGVYVNNWSGPTLLRYGADGGSNAAIVPDQDNATSTSSIMKAFKNSNNSIKTYVFNGGQQKTENSEINTVAYRLNKHTLFNLESDTLLAAKGYKGMIAFEIAGLAKQSSTATSDVEVGKENRRLKSDKITVASNTDVLKFAGAYYAKGLTIPEGARLNELNTLVTLQLKDANTDEVVKEIWNVPFARLANATTTDGEYRTINIPLNGLKGREVYLDVTTPSHIEPTFVDDYYMYDGEDLKMKKFFAEPALMPTEYALHQNYPNPFNPSTTIRFDLVEPQYVTMKIYNSLGQEIKDLVNEYYGAGSHEVTLNASSLSSGAYFYRMVAGKFSAVKSFVLVK